MAKRAAEGAYGIPELLQFSAVCGMGLDTVPIPSGATAEQIAAHYMDVCALAYRLQKPLSTRFLPVADADAGDTCDFGSPYMCPGVVFAI